MSFLLKPKNHIALHGWAIFGFFWAVFKQPNASIDYWLLGFGTGVLAGLSQIFLMAIVDRLLYGGVQLFMQEARQ